MPWTVDEHNAFLDGLASFGKGRWKDISKHHVPSRTPTQVASHAQKYEKRVRESSKPLKRKSIFDIRLEGMDESPCVTPPEASEDEPEPEPEPDPEPEPEPHVVLKPKPIRPGLAIEFDCISPLLLYHYYLMTRSLPIHRPKVRYPLAAQM
jgi:SHAQKYF class myb-like DNA-binding protein